MKYNKSEIMKAAWESYKLFRSFSAGKKPTFSQCLTQSWENAKRAKLHAEHEAARAEAGIINMHYGEYKRNYAGCKTVDGSYDKRTKTIDVYTKGVPAAKSAAPASTASAKNNHSGLCPRCHTYCYGDCMA